MNSQVCNAHKERSWKEILLKREGFLVWNAIDKPFYYVATRRLRRYQWKRKPFRNKFIRIFLAMSLRKGNSRGKRKQKQHEEEMICVVRC